MKHIRIAPKTEEIYELLKQQIISGVYDNSGMLPPEPILADTLSISRKTLRSAMSRLALENYVERIKGKGTFVCSRNNKVVKILVIVGDMDDITNSTRYILPGIQQEALVRNIEIDICSSCVLSTFGDVSEIAQRINSKNYMGVISFESNFNGNEKSLIWLSKIDVPVVFARGLKSDAQITGFTVLGTDFSSLVKDGLTYFATMGHRQVAYLDFYKSHRIPKAEYFDLLKEIGLESNNNSYTQISSVNDGEIIEKDIANFFSTLKELPSAILCFSDFYAVCLYNYLKKQNIRIPYDISVLSIGGLLGGDFCEPSLSSLDFNCIGIGRKVVQTIFELKTKGLKSLGFVVTPYYLSSRDSIRKL